MNIFFLNHLNVTTIIVLLVHHHSILIIIFTETQWHLWVKTSNDSLSGTDAHVFVCLYGTKGKTDEVELDNKSDVFEQGNTDEFDIHVSDVGKPYKLRIFHDDSSLLSGWKLDQVSNLRDSS